MHRRVISGLRTEVLTLWLVGIATAGACTLYSDLTASGLRSTQLFLSIGYGVYPVFYGSIAYLMFWLGRRLLDGAEYITAADDEIRIGPKVVQAEGLHVEARRNWLGLREIEFLRDGKREMTVKAYFLSRPMAEVIADLNYVIAKHRIAS